MRGEGSLKDTRPWELTTCRAQIPGPEGLALTSRRRGALAGMMVAGGAGVAIIGLCQWGNFQAKGAANRGKPLSAPAVSGAAASASAAALERRRSTLLDSGKSMVQRLA